MKTQSISTATLRRASAALVSLLGQISTIRRQNIRIEFPSNAHPAQAQVDLLAQVDLFGRRHTLACIFRECGLGTGMEETVRKLCRHVRQLGKNARPVLIAPELSEATRALCRSQGVDYLDLAGNARLHLDEIFIALHTSPGEESHGIDTWTAPPEFAPSPAPVAAQSVS